ncbi:superfamily II helicase [Catovirus CTV1]|uniref:Replication origin-binding protein n=1 Tax=Catovirus CTV1 TaxID=1977631 RepID=A0A1V0S9U7_9VIRU|nr:superfamily II helicase [Catovirus CTV1]
MNPLNKLKIKDTIVFYGNGAKNELLKLGKNYNFKFFHYVDKKTLKFCSAGFDKIDDFLNMIKPINKKYYIYEYLFSNKLCKPYIDYEYYSEKKPSIESVKDKLNKFKQDVVKLFNKMYKAEIKLDDIIALDSSGKKENRYKLSFHFIINSKYVFRSNKHVAHFAEQLHRIHNEVDMSVYSTDRMMRTILSCKDFGDDRMLKLIDNNLETVNVELKDLEKYLISALPKDHIIINLNLKEKKKLVASKIKHTDAKEKKNLIESELNNTIKKIQYVVQKKYYEDSYYTGETYVDEVTKYSYYKFNYCDRNQLCFTGHKHDYLGFYCYIDNLNNIIVKCFSKKCGENKYIIGNACDPIEDINYIRTNDSFLPESKIVNEKIIEFHNKYKSMVIKSQMGTGKTHVITKYIDKYNPKRILLISTRQSYANNVFERLKDYNFVNYLDNKKTYPFADRLIVQLESLINLQKNPDLRVYDLVILDEIESIMFHFSSSTIAEKSETTFDFLHKMCCSKKSKILVLDADYDERGHEFVKSLGNYETIKNEYKNHERTLIMTKNYNYYLTEIFKSIDKGENICIVGLSASKLTSIAHELEKKKIKFILHTRDTDDKIKKGLINVNELWKNYQVVLFSPTISVGVSHDVDHFDRIFAIVIGNTCPPRVFVQMLGRVRKPKNYEILTYYDPTISVRMDRVVYNYDDLFDYYKYIAVEPFLKSEIVEENDVYSHQNRLGLYDKIMIMNDIENMNKCPEYFMTGLNQICSKIGYNIMFKDIDPKDCENKIELDTKAHVKKIIDSPDIDNKTFYQISQKINSNDASKDEKFSFQKYIIKKFWKIDNIDQEFLDKYYRQEHKLIKLRKILGLSVDSQYETIVLLQKTDVVNNILKMTGFDVQNTNKVVKGEELHKNIIKLMTDSSFSKNYDNIRILFGKAKKKLNKDMKLPYLISMINSYLNEFCVCIKSNRKRVWNTQKKNWITVSEFVIKIDRDYIKFIL